MSELNMNEIPKWDVALEAIAKEKYNQLGRPMELSDFKQLGHEYQVRFDDLMHSLCQLVKHEQWQQQGADESGIPASDEQLESLFVYDRLDEKIAEKYHVSWQPVD
jgi:hypothetical protein